MLKSLYIYDFFLFFLANTQYDCELVKVIREFKQISKSMMGRLHERLAILGRQPYILEIYHVKTKISML